MDKPKFSPAVALLWGVMPDEAKEHILKMCSV